MVHKGTSIFFTGWSTVSGFDLVWFSSLSSERLCIFGLHILFFLLTSFSLSFSELQPGGIGPRRGWLTIVLQCCDTVGWVIWPVKSSPKWPIMCRVGRWTPQYHTMPTANCESCRPPSNGMRHWTKPIPVSSGKSIGPAVHQNVPTCRPAFGGCMALWHCAKGSVLLLGPALRQLIVARRNLVSWFSGTSLKLFPPDVRF